MWPSKYWPVVYWTGEYWPKVGGAVVPIPELCFPLTVVTHNPIRTVVTPDIVRSVETVCN